MLNEDKIKEQYQLALIDQKQEKTMEDSRVFYKSDYISKELLKSFFSGTLAFIGIAVLFVLNDVEELMNMLNKIDYENFAMQLISLYLGFIAIYFIITYVVYVLRFEKQKKTVKKYKTHLKRLNKIYSSEDK